MLILFIYAYDVLLVNRLSFLGCIISLCAIVLWFYSLEFCRIQLRDVYWICLLR